MLGLRTLHRTGCASCRLRADLSAKLLARSRKPTTSFVSTRGFAGTSHNGFPRERRKVRGREGGFEGFMKEQEELERVKAMMAAEALAGPEGEVREGELDALPEGMEEVVPEGVEGQEEGLEQTVDLDASLTNEEIAQFARERFGDSLPLGVLDEEQYKVYERLYGTPLPMREEVEGEEEEGVEAERTGLLREGEDGVLEEVEWEDVEEMDEGDELEVEGDMGNVAEGEEAKFNFGDVRLAQDMQSAFAEESMAEEVEEGDEGPRTHPFTLASRFGTSPSTVTLPKDKLVEPINLLLSAMPNIHLADVAHRTFGGVGLPYSASTPKRGQTMQAKPIALDAQQGSMSPAEGDVFISTVMPAVYASVTSVLAETRKRLGTQWAEDLVRKAQAGELRILDAGGAGVGVHAVREVLRAEWERMTEDSSTAVAPAGGKAGGVGASPPLGTATVLVSSHSLRRRASQLLENTTFVPRLPDYIHAENAPATGKFDIIIAPHTLWPLREDHVRKKHMQNLWTMLSTNSGVLVLLEKGVARGFELVAGAREMLLDKYIASPGSESTHINGSEPEIAWDDAETEGATKEPSPETQATSTTKEQGMIIAPCTNHAPCPLYQPKGMLKGRTSLCQFEQRYIRPPFLQKILGARDKNFEDVKFSYLAVMRGRDLRSAADSAIPQGVEASEQAFAGYHDAEGPAPSGLALPRLVLPPIKRRGHVIMDVCTPAGALERWTVPRSYSRQAFRDARKATWGDLWALGAKSRIAREAKVGKHARVGELDVKAKKSKRGGDEEGSDEGTASGLFRGQTKEKKTGKGPGGKMRTGKVGGIRDKRDKKGTGNGRRRNQGEQGGSDE